MDERADGQGGQGQTDSKVDVRASGIWPESVIQLGGIWFLRLELAGAVDINVQSKHEGIDGKDSKLFWEFV